MIGVAPGVRQLFWRCSGWGDVCWDNYQQFLERDERIGVRLCGVGGFVYRMKILCADYLGATIVQLDTKQFYITYAHI